MAGIPSLIDAGRHQPPEAEQTPPCGEQPEVLGSLQWLLGLRAAKQPPSPTLGK